MAIVDTIESIKTHLGESYGACEEKGASIPDNKNLENLPDTILSISGGGEDGLSGTVYSNTTQNPISSTMGLWLTGDISSTLKDVDFANSTYLYYLFRNMQITNCKMNNKSCDSVIQCLSWFEGCSKLKNIELENISFPNATHFQNIFYNITALENIKVTNCDLHNVTELYGLCYNASNVIRVDLSGLYVDNVTSAGNMFRNCDKVAYIDISNINFTNCTSYSRIFSCGFSARVEDGAYANGIPYVYVKDKANQDWILGLTGTSRPSTWSTNNVIIAGSADDHR